MEILEMPMHRLLLTMNLLNDWMRLSQPLLRPKCKRRLRSMLAKLKICLVDPIVLKKALQGPRLLLKKRPVLGLLLQALADPSVLLQGLLRLKIYLVLGLLRLHQ